MKQKELAVALKGIVLVCLLSGLLLCGVLMPIYGWGWVRIEPALKGLFWFWLVALWVTCVPVLVVLGLVWRMATRIGADNSFCLENARSLKWICFLALGDTAAYLIGSVVFCLQFGGMPPFLVLVVLAILLVGIAIAVVTALLSHLIQKAAQLKADQDLTI